MKWTEPSPIPMFTPPGCSDLNPSSLYQLHGRLQLSVLLLSHDLALIGITVPTRPFELFDRVQPCCTCSEHFMRTSPKKIVFDRPSFTSVNCNRWYGG